MPINCAVISGQFKVQTGRRIVDRNVRRLLINVKIHLTNPVTANPNNLSRPARRIPMPFVDRATVIVVRITRIQPRIRIRKTSIPVNWVSADVILMITLSAIAVIEKILVTVPNDFVRLIPFPSRNIGFNDQFNRTFRRKISVVFVEADVIDRWIASGLNLAD